jgi:hypothetical protein
VNKLQDCGNLLEYIQGDCDIHILRVYPYGSAVGEPVYAAEAEKANNELNNLFQLVWENTPHNWRDNKIVIEVMIGSCWRAFLEYHDYACWLGFAVKPSMYLPKANTNRHGIIEPITISRR